MERTDFVRFSDDLDAAFDIDPRVAKTRVGILINDAVSQGLVERASLHLELVPVLLSAASLQFDSLTHFELIIADEGYARKIRSIFVAHPDRGDGTVPAVVAVIPANVNGEEPFNYPDSDFDGVLPLPHDSEPVAVQLSLLLYSHRAFARRYQSALAELHLCRRIFGSVRSGISVASATLPDMPLIYVNPAFEAMSGYRFEEVRGKNCRILQGQEQDQPALTTLREAIRDKHETRVVLKNFRKDGTPFWNELSLSPIFNREGDLSHFVGIQTDVTARVEIEAALRESEKLAAVGRLASSISHEINNPLEAVMNLVYIAQHTESAAETKKCLAMADEELRRMKLITTQALRFCKQSTKPQSVACMDLMDSVLDMYQARLQNAGITVAMREHPSRPIVCMESEIRQVLINLLSNAIDAMNGSGGSLMVRSREATMWRTGSRGLMMTIADTGGGISAETMQNIYKAFYTTKGIGSTGLGLWISSEIIERHNGRLTVRSSQREDRSGTVFQLFLPYPGLAC